MSEEWQPLETAPKDGRAILGFIPGWFAICGTWFQDGQWWMAAGQDGRMGCPPPTHWMPLPEPPRPVP